MVRDETADWWLQVEPNTKKNLEELVIGTTTTTSIEEDDQQKGKTMPKEPPLTTRKLPSPPFHVLRRHDTPTGECTAEEVPSLKGLYDEIQAQFQEVMTVYEETLEEAASLRTSSKPLWNPPPSVERKIFRYSPEASSPISTNRTRSTMAESDDESEEIDVDEFVITGTDGDGCISWSISLPKEVRHFHEFSDALDILAELVHKLWIQQLDRVRSQQQKNRALDAKLQGFQREKSHLENQNQELLRQLESMKSHLLATKIQFQVQPQERVERPLDNGSDNRTNRKVFYQSSLVKNDRDMDTIFLLPSRNNSFSETSQRESPEDISLDKNPAVLTKGGEENELSGKLREAENKYLRAKGRLRRQGVEYENLQLEIVDVRKQLAVAQCLIEDLNQSAKIQELLQESMLSNGQQKKEDVISSTPVVENAMKPEQANMEELHEQSERSNPQSCRVIRGTEEKCASVQVEDKDDTVNEGKGEKIASRPQERIAEEARSSQVEGKKDSEDKKEVSLEAKISAVESDELVGKVREQQELIETLREELTTAKLECNELLQTNTRNKAMIEEIMVAKQEESVRSREARSKLCKAESLAEKMKAQLNANLVDLEKLEQSLSLKRENISLQKLLSNRKDSGEKDQLDETLVTIQGLLEKMIEERKKDLSQLSMQEEQETVDTLEQPVKTSKEDLQKRAGPKTTAPLLNSFLGFVRKNI